jgi:hypothetical protein
MINVNFILTNSKKVTQSKRHNQTKQKPTKKKQQKNNTFKRCFLLGSSDDHSMINTYIKNIFFKNEQTNKNKSRIHTNVHADFFSNYLMFKDTMVRSRKSKEGRTT